MAESDKGRRECGRGAENEAPSGTRSRYIAFSDGTGGGINGSEEAKKRLYNRNNDKLTFPEMTSPVRRSRAELLVRGIGESCW